MPELLSVGLDVGTTTTQLILSKLLVENRASGFAAPKMEIVGRQIHYRSPVRFTPLREDGLVDEEALKTLVEAEYAASGIHREDVDTGAIIITGETSRKENARRALRALSAFAGDFVVATAGPHLESLLAAKGSGAEEYSRQSDRPVLHMDIGGGTTNLALIREGKILRTGCLDVGGRLVKFDEMGNVTYVSAAVEGICGLRPGMRPDPGEVEALASRLAEVLEMAAGLRPQRRLLEECCTREAGACWEPPTEPVVLSFSGGVADCIEKEWPPLAFGDMGPALGKAIRESRLCQGSYVLGRETVRATVIGAGCHSTQLSGSTVWNGGIPLPVKDLPVVSFSAEEQESPGLTRQIQRLLREREPGPAVLAFPGWPEPDYRRIAALAEAITGGAGEGALYVAVETDMAKALGQALQLRRKAPCLCIDRIGLEPESYLDIGEPVGPCLPVVIKTLVLRS